MHTAFLCIAALGLLQTLLLLQFCFVWLRRSNDPGPGPLSETLLTTFAANLAVGPLLVVNGILMLALEWGGSPRNFPILYVAETVALYGLALGFLNRIRVLQIATCVLCALGTLAMSVEMLVPTSYAH